MCECFMCLNVFSPQSYFPLSTCLHVCVCVVSSGSPLSCVSHICVLYAQHYVVVGAGAGVLSQQPSGLQQSSLARHRHVPCPPRLTVVGGQTDAHRAGAVPHQLLRPIRRWTGMLNQQRSLQVLGLLTILDHFIYAVDFFLCLYFSMIN